MSFDAQYEAWTPTPTPPLLDARPQVWRFELREPQDGEWELLSEDEKRRADRLIIESKRWQLIVGRSTIRRLLAGYLGLEPAELLFAYGEHGDPFLDPQVHPHAPSFNLSHSESLALLAVASPGLPVGVDIEFRRPGREFVPISRTFFAPREREYLQSIEDPVRLERAFYRAWSAKEAYLKAWRTGLSFASSRFCVDYRPEAPVRLISTEMPGDQAGAWVFHQLPAGPDYAASLCVPAGIPPPLQLQEG